MGGMASRTFLHPMTRAELAEEFAEAESSCRHTLREARPTDNSGFAN